MNDVEFEHAARARLGERLWLATYYPNLRQYAVFFWVGRCIDYVMREDAVNAIDAAVDACYKAENGTTNG